MKLLCKWFGHTPANWSSKYDDFCTHCRVPLDRDGNELRPQTKAAPRQQEQTDKGKEV